MNKTLVWSYGGGVQSVAILVLIAQGRIKKPDVVVMADTGRESKLTLDYTKKYAMPLLSELGLFLEVASHELAKDDLYTSKGKLLIPAFTNMGMLRAFCSGCWKRDVIRRYLRIRGYGPKKPVDMMFGMSLDELDRMRISGFRWINNVYPLCFDVRLRRFECENLIRRFGLPVPPKSACWMCPHRNNQEWLYQKENCLEDHNKAVELELSINKRDKKGGLFLHRDRVLLSEVEFTKKESGQLELCANYCRS